MIDKKLQHEKIVANGYDGTELTAGIVHIGLGAFHRAHQALYTHETIAATGAFHWGICAANIFGGQELVQELQEQDNAYTVTEMNPDGSRTVKLATAIARSLAVEEDRRPLLEIMSAETTRIVSLTITEKGYCLNPATGELMIDNPLIAHDLENTHNPKTALGVIVAALGQRKAKGRLPFTVLSCDNVPDNGKRARAAVIQMAEAMDQELAAWIREHVAFPCTMVDRIVPAMTEESFADVQSYLGFADKGAIVTEAYRQWVIEDHFTMGRPEWDKIDGAMFVSDVQPYEEMKLRMLNGSHSILAYLGYLAGYETIDACMQDEQFVKVTRHYMNHEAAITLEMPEATDFASYAEKLIERFSNPGLKHRTWQIAMDGSQKVPQRWLNAARTLLAEEKSLAAIALGIGGWMHYVSGTDEQGHEIDVRDPMAEQLKAVAIAHQGEPAQLVKAFLAMDAVFDPALAANERFVAAVTDAYNTIREQGAKQAVALLAERI
ncbi:mannitol dehydrogenase family protein [Endozoicomonas sp. GU-1]|uniref:mannitol dehydrogenase family protein n=1 Tax=Endozoicomonas sp. GU-1 TaxID=3009078 RepID=UPI0022B5CB6F|nr:mannitol dehydrogenase family protein [Endozoicomonas sp. GU-1]WBA82042.1 mannitol dehydrogenase family protein [Endozoicomonas sp. GU-1]WBA84990.1 mannitol dehydrogenase family protein [Endozoicomonas sp. GU-1]